MNFVQVTGPSGQMTWIRGGPKCLDACNISEAIDNRLNALVINLYLLDLLSLLSLETR